MTYFSLITKTLRIISVICIPLSLRSKTRRGATLLLPTWICSCQSVGKVNFELFFTTSVTISISLLQIFRSSVATSNLCPPMAFLSHNSSDTPGLSPLMNVSFWGRFNFPISFLGRDISRKVFNSSLRKFYGRYVDCIKQYEVPLSRMLHDILEDGHIQRHPPLIRHYTNFFTVLLIWTLLLNLTFYLIARCFHRSFAMGAACHQKTLTPPDTWFCPTLGLAYVLILGPISPELVLLPDFLVLNIPLYFCFVSKSGNMISFGDVYLSILEHMQVPNGTREYELLVGMPHPLACNL